MQTKHLVLIASLAWTVSAAPLIALAQPEVIEQQTEASPPTDLATSEQNQDQNSTANVQPDSSTGSSETLSSSNPAPSNDVESSSSDRGVSKTTPIKPSDADPTPKATSSDDPIVIGILGAIGAAFLYVYTYFNTRCPKCKQPFSTKIINTVERSKGIIQASEKTTYRTFYQDGVQKREENKQYIPPQEYSVRFHTKKCNKCAHEHVTQSSYKKNI